MKKGIVGVLVWHLFQKKKITDILEEFEYTVEKED